MYADRQTYPSNKAARKAARAFSRRGFMVLVRGRLVIFA